MKFVVVDCKEFCIGGEGVIGVIWCDEVKVGKGVMGDVGVMWG